MNKEINTNVGILIFLMAATILVVADFIVLGYELDYFGSRSIYSSDENVDDNFNNYAFDSVIQNNLINIAQNELYVFGGKSSVADLNNNEKLFLSYKNVLNFNLVDSFDGNVILDWYSNSSLSNNALVLDDIMYYNSNCVLYDYDELSGAYNKTDGCGFGVNFVDVAYSEVSDYVFKDGKYYISVKYLWFYNEPAGDHSIFGSYSDAYNQENSVGVANADDFGNATVMSNLIKNNNVETYNFVLDKESDGFKLVDFTRVD